MSVVREQGAHEQGVVSSNLRLTTYDLLVIYLKKEENGWLFCHFEYRLSTDISSVQLRSITNCRALKFTDFISAFMQRGLLGCLLRSENLEVRSSLKLTMVVWWHSVVRELVM
ncbi:hypothetical protein B7486_44400 [cyanobacterium TDX16]|nr:hypothetical protein B7486_44400 [cyanobacterium TDX16]